MVELYMGGNLSTVLTGRVNLGVSTTQLSVHTDGIGVVAVFVIRDVMMCAHSTVRVWM